MTGPEHYREAERILASIAEASQDPAKAINHAANQTLAAGAQVHATLALAAATALTAPDSNDRNEDDKAWFAVAAVRPRYDSPEAEEL